MVHRLDPESERSEDEEDSSSSSSFQRSKSEIPNEELHFSEKWFHGKLKDGRDEAERLLKAYSYLGKWKFDLCLFSKFFKNW